MTAKGNAMQSDRLIALRNLLQRWVACTVDLEAADKELSEMYQPKFTIEKIDTAWVTLSSSWSPIGTLAALAPTTVVNPKVSP